MRVIEQQIIDAIRNDRHLKNVRDEIIRNSDGTMDIYLWGHKIARIDKEHKYLHVSTCGYATQTTHRRINAIFAALNLGCSVCLRGKCSFWGIRDTGDWVVQRDTVEID